MLHVFSLNRVKLLARTPTTTDIKGRREYLHRLLGAAKSFTKTIASREERKQPCPVPHLPGLNARTKHLALFT
jgi:hypothetical protein